MPNPAYVLTRAQNPRSCVIFSSPHSGAEYPAEFLALSKLDKLALRSSEDAYVDELFADAPVFGAPLLAARLPRAYVDVNRGVDELDPALITGLSAVANNPRIAAGLGVVPRVVGNRQVIRSGKITMAEVDRRIAEGYIPYHTCLAELMETHLGKYGISVLMDCHSMPHAALSRDADIVIGDRFGASCGAWISGIVVDIFKGAGFNVVRNTPFSGGYITHKYGRPSRNMHAVQIEINRSLYMDEAKMTRCANYQELRAVFTMITKALAEIGCACTCLAAE
ncbi:MAG: N-formylglutamate amidohydrolase [Paracoccaceae bacterium]